MCKSHKDPPLDAFMSVRVSKKTMRDFRDYCERLNRSPQYLIREFISATLEERIKIKPRKD
jgi:predicted DNA-binding protein